MANASCHCENAIERIAEVSLRHPTHYVTLRYSNWIALGHCLLV